MSKWLANLIVCLMVFSVVVSSIQLHPVRAEEQIQQEKTYVSVLLSEDVQINDDKGNVVATLIKGSEQLGYLIEGEVFVNWFGYEIRIDQSSIEQQRDAAKPLAQEIEMETVTAETLLSVERTTGEQMATIAEGAIFQIVEEFEEYYVTFLSGEELKIIKPKSDEPEITDEAPQINDDQTINEDSQVKEDLQESGEQQTSEEPQKSVNEQVKVTEQTEEQTNKIEEKSIVASENDTSFSPSDKYFQTTVENIPVYIKKNGDLVQVATLQENQVYKRTGDYTSWHAIKVGNMTAYVPKDGTTYSDGASLENENNLKNRNEFITFNEDAVIYDNSSGELIQFATMKKGVRLPVLNQYSDWYAIDVSGRIGFVRKDHVTAEFTASMKYFEVTEDQDVGYQKVNGRLVEVTTLMKNQVYPRVADYTSWHEIKYGNGTVFVKKEGTRPALAKMIENENTRLKNSPYKVKITENTFVYDNTSGSLIEFAELYKGNEYPIISDHGNWLKVDVSGRIGYIRKSDTKIEFSQSIKYFTPTENNLPVYDNSSGSLEIVGYLKAGETYHRTNDFTNWHEIQFGNISGYVSKEPTEPVLNRTYRNVSDRYLKAGEFKTSKSTPISYYVGDNLVPFAYIAQNEQYPFVEDRGSYVKVNLGDRYGFVKKSDVTIQYTVGKNLVNPKVVYSYTQMSKDIDEIINTYPGLATKHIIGKSVDGRNLYAVKLGKGSTEIMINASHHAREHMTTNIVMEMLDQYAQSYVKNVKIDGYAVKSILDRASIWFVPMVNPDGVTLVQKGHTSARNPSQVLKINGGKTDFSAWKANIRGVDLNRQYPAGWSTIVGDTGKPSPQNYKGPKPLSEPESKAMYDFTNGKNFKTAVSYHSAGEILYWHYKQGTERTNRDREIANMINSKTGYKLVAPKENPSGGGFTDWFISEHLKPGFTPEISPYVGERPVPLSSFDSIWAENKAIGVMLADEAYKNRNNR